MSFFGEIDNLELLEENAKFALQLEEQEARKILAIYGKVREQLVRKIAKFRGEFTGQQARVTLMQVDSQILILRTRLGASIGDGVDVMLKASLDQLGREIDMMSYHFTGSRQLLPLDSIRIALDERNFLLNQYQTSIAAYSEDVRQRIVTGLQEALVKRSTSEEVIRAMGNFWEAEEWRLRRVVRTELHNVHGHGKLAGMEDVKENFLPDLKKTLYHPLDHRTGEDSQWLIANPLVVEVNEPFRYEWPPGSGKWRVYQAPPDRPNDRSIVIPYRASWD